MIKRKKEICLNRDFLRKNNNELAINDKRWNTLFLSYPKTYLIKKIESNINILIQEKKDIINKRNKISNRKKNYLSKILKLTEKQDEKAFEEMDLCKNTVNELNKEIQGIDNEIEELNNKIEEENCNLLEETVYVLYKNISKSKRRIERLGYNIDKYRELLKEYIQKKQDLDNAQSEAYTYLHNVIGPEEAEKLDRIYLEEKSDN